MGSYFQVNFLWWGGQKIETQRIYIQHDLDHCSKTEYLDPFGIFGNNHSGFYQMKRNNVEIS